MRVKRLAGLLAVAAGALLAFSTQAQSPRYGGELVFPVPSEPPSYDGHRENTFGLIHPLAPFYNTLLRVDPNDPGGTKPVPSIASTTAYWPLRSEPTPGGGKIILS